MFTGVADMKHGNILAGRINEATVYPPSSCRSTYTDSHLGDSLGASRQQVPHATCQSNNICGTRIPKAPVGKTLSFWRQMFHATGDF